jgi:hypothetical protein
MLYTHAMQALQQATKALVAGDLTAAATTGSKYLVRCLLMALAGDSR